MIPAGDDGARKRELDEATQRGLVPKTTDRCDGWDATDYEIMADRMGDEGYVNAEEWFRYIAWLRVKTAEREWRAGAGVGVGSREPVRGPEPHPE